MKTTDINIQLTEAYLGLLKNLSADSKLEIIARLSKSMKTKKKANNISLKSLYGAFITDQSADELINEIKQARSFNRKREAL